MAAALKIKSITGRLVRDAERSLDDKERLEAYDEQLWLDYGFLVRRETVRIKSIAFMHQKSAVSPRARITRNVSLITRAVL
jgi:hypothetical protein